MVTIDGGGVDGDGDKYMMLGVRKEFVGGGDGCNNRCVSGSAVVGGDN